MNFKPWLALPAALAAFALTQPATATAAVVSYTYDGFIDFGNDAAGLFGAPGGVLTGKTFSATFYRDDALALPGNIYLGDANSYVTGEGEYSPVWAKLTIDGVTLYIGGGSGEQTQFDDGYVEGFSHSALGLLGELAFSGNTLGTFAPTLGNVLAGPDYHTLTSLPAFDELNFSVAGNFQYTSPESRGLYTFANLTPTSFSVGGGGPTAPAPEPAAWALMIVGFGGVGAMLRRRAAFA